VNSLRHSLPTVKRIPNSAFGKPCVTGAGGLLCWCPASPTTLINLIYATPSIGKKTSKKNRSKGDVTVTPFPPQVANTAAFDETTNLLQSRPDLMLQLMWHEERGAWECRFVDDSSFEHTAIHANVATAILKAIDRVEAYKDEEDYKHESY
jgi:hypothetical protein